MGEKIRISRHGLTRCPSCTSHIRVAASLDETQCPFCDSSFPTSWFAEKERPGKGTSSLSRAILMASMLGLPFAGCGDDGKKGGDSGADVAADQIGQPLYGIPMDWYEDGNTGDAGTSDAGADAVIDQTFQPPYGIPMDMVEPAPDEGFAPEYGLPPDAE